MLTAGTRKAPQCSPHVVELVMLRRWCLRRPRSSPCRRHPKQLKRRQPLPMSKNSYPFWRMPSHTSLPHIPSIQNVKKRSAFDIPAFPLGR